MSDKIWAVALEDAERGPLSPREPKSRNSRTRLSALLAAIVLLLPLHVAFAAPGEDDKLQAFFKDYLEQNFRLQPMARRAGRTGRWVCWFSHAHNPRGRSLVNGDARTA